MVIGIRSGRVRLRPVQEEDFDFVYNLWFDADTYRRSSWPPYKPISKEKFKEWFLERFLPKAEKGDAPSGNAYIIEVNGKSVGLCGFHVDWKRLAADIWYEITPEERGKGIGKEAVKALVEHIFKEYPVEIVEAETQSDNVPSIRLLESLGFTRTGYDKYAYMVKGRYKSSVKYGIRRKKWDRSPK
ncbi:MAG: hypothetical protein PWP76_191 [Candidatus Diapherotrites archaeon]|nr:hypothetical protein [Candidatus Diapherotrites archaeon]MDN5366852.1 hypothetical protein [Candidatus Diapherotrites archaeon]